MELMDALRNAIQNWIIPELDKLHAENGEIRATLALTNKRLDDVLLQLADQSRRIDETNKRIDETNKRIDESNKRIDETNKRIDQVREGLARHIDATNARIDHLRDELAGQIDATNKRLDHLFEVIVRRDEHVGLERWVREIDQRLRTLEQRSAA